MTPERTTGGMPLFVPRFSKFTGVWVASVFLTSALGRPLLDGFTGTTVRTPFRTAVVLVVLAAGAAGAAAALVARRRAGNASPPPPRPVGATAEAVVVTALTLASTISAVVSPEELIHFLSFGVLGVLLAEDLLPPCTAVRSAQARALALGTVVGVLDEGLQFLLPGRVADFRDVGLNILGVVTGVAVGTVTGRLSGKCSG